MKHILIILGIVTLVIILEITGITEGLSYLGIPGLFFSQASYNNLCLTTKPYGFPGSENAIKYWQDRPKNWSVEYSEKRVRGDINTVRSSSVGNFAATDAQSIDPEYYHNPVAYCKKYPNKYPCPNFWITGRTTRSAPRSDDMYVPGLVSGNTKYIKDADIDDNYYTKIISPDREDQAMC